MLVLFVVIIAGPIIASRFLEDLKVDIPMNLLQPKNWNNNDTRGRSVTGSGTVADQTTSSSRRRAANNNKRTAMPMMF